MENHLYHLCKNLADSDEMNYEILVYNTEKKTVEEEFFGKKLVRASRTFKFGSIPFSFDYLRHIRDYEGDIIHLHEPNPIGTIGYLLFGKKKKLVVTYHYNVGRYKFLFSLYYYLQKRLIKKAEKVIVTAKNNYLYSPVLSKFEEKCTIVGLGVDPEEFTMTDQIQNQIQEIKKKYPGQIVLFVGRLSHYKGIEYLIKAAKDENYTVLIIGQGEKEEMLKNVAGDSKNIVFLKNIDDVKPYYYACDLFVLPSINRSEAFGIVQLEAMICEKPVICTNLKTGVPEVQVHDETGLVVSPENTKELKEAIHSLLSDNEKREKMGKAAKQRVLRHFTVQENSRAHLELFLEITKNQG